MTRRKFIRFLGSTAVAWPLAAHGQPKIARLGVLLFSSSDPQLPPIQDRLRELGYFPGKNLLVMQRDGNGSYDRLAELAAELVAEKPDLLLALGGDIAPYAAKATSTIPMSVLSASAYSFRWAMMCSARSATVTAMVGPLDPRADTAGFLDRNGAPLRVNTPAIRVQ